MTDLRPLPSLAGLAAEVWPILLTGVLAAGMLGFFLRGAARTAARVAAIAGAALLIPPAMGFAAFVADEALSRWRRRVERAETHTVLTQPMVLDGAVLPAGTEVEWLDRSHSRIILARLPQPAEVLGVRTRYLRRDGDGGWIVALQGPHEIDGWPCTDGEVQLSAAGRLRGCALARPTPWQGWTLPERTEVHPMPSRHVLHLTVPWSTPLEMPLVSPVVGPLPWLLSLNDDGSPEGANYDREAPHQVAGQPLSGDVRWEYDPATYGMGRERPPRRVSGSVYVPDAYGMVVPNVTGRVARRHVVLPWEGLPAGPRAD